MTDSLIQRSLAGGELAPVYHARADAARYTQSLKTCLNFLVRREGGVSNRPGLRFIGACKDALAGKLLLRYKSETPGESILIEAGAGYFRFYRNGAAITITPPAAYNNATAYFPGDLVASGGVNYYCHAATTGNAPPNASFWAPLTGTIYEVPSPYGGADPLFKWVQSGFVITLTHPSHPPRELTFHTLTRWILTDVDTGPVIGPPSGLTATQGTPGPGPLIWAYVVTARLAATDQESIASVPFVMTGAPTGPTPTAPNVLTWNPVVGASVYDVYADPFQNGVFGRIGEVAITSFRDPGLVPDFQVIPPVALLLFNATNEYPAVATYFQQRRFFGYQNTDTEIVRGSRIGFYSDFTESAPLQDDDGLEFHLAGDDHNPVRWLVALRAGLIVLTDAGEWSVQGSVATATGSRTPLTPSSIDAEQETYVGAHPDVRPVKIGNAIVYVQTRGSIVRELRFDAQVSGLGGQDLTLFATHLFEGKTVKAIDLQQVPHSITWAILSDGTLLGLTYIPDQEVWGWHRHSSGAGAQFESICVVPEVAEDAVYVIVKRTIGGADVRYIERLASRTIVTFDVDAFFVDCGLSYNGPPVTTLTGLDHLNGEIVAVVADGHVVFNGDPTSASAAAFTVTAGSLTIPTPAVNVHIGLPIQYADLETLDLDVQGSQVRDKRKRVASVTLLVDRSSRSCWLGPDAAHLRQISKQVWEAPADETTGQLRVDLTSGFSEGGRFLIRQVDPLPLTILGIIPNVEMGG